MVTQHEQQVNLNLSKGVLFNILLFLSIFLSNPMLSAVGVGGVVTNVREIGLILMPIVYAFYPSKNIYLFDKRCRITVVFLLIAIFCSELFKILAYNSSISGAMRSLRVSLALTTSLFLIIQGVKLDPKLLTRTVLYSLLVSFLLTIVLDVLGFGPQNIAAGDRELAISASAGRYVNQNASIGLIGVLFLINRKAFSEVFGENKKVAYITLVLSVIMLIISFNRTLLLGLAIILAVNTVTNFTLKKVFKVFCYLAILFLSCMALYNNNPAVKAQVDRRILVAFEGNDKNVNADAIKKDVYEGNRDFLYRQFFEKLIEYPYFGVPSEVGLAKIEDREESVNTTDISLMTVTLKYGWLSGFLFLVLVFKISRSLKRAYINNNKIYNFLYLPFVVGFVCSFNLDLFVRHNFILVFILLLMCFIYENRVVYLIKGVEKKI
jgi:hypothetical protein